MNDIIPTIQNFIETKDIENLTLYLEDLELRSSCFPSGPNPHNNSQTQQYLSFDPPFYALLLTCYLIKNDLDAARFLFKRLPREFKSSAELQVLKACLMYLWIRDFPSFYATLNSFGITESVSDGMTSPENSGMETTDQKIWTPLVEVLVVRLVESVRSRGLAFLEKAYSSIGSDDAAVYVGMDKDLFLGVVGERGWASDGEFVLPVNKVDESKKGKGIGLDQISDLTDYIIHLESK